MTDPREEYEDLLVTESRETLPPDEFEEAAASEPATVGWVAFGFVFDDADRVVLVRQPWADGWLTPGGALEPGESLAETFAREVREETGVRATPVRPHAVDDLTFVNERTGATAGWTTVLFEGRAETTALADDPGLEDEEVTDVAWFDDLPDDVFNPEMTERVYRQCLGD